MDCNTVRTQFKTVEGSPSSLTLNSATIFDYSWPSGTTHREITLYSKAKAPFKALLKYSTVATDTFELWVSVNTAERFCLSCSSLEIIAVNLSSEPNDIHVVVADDVVPYTKGLIYENNIGVDSNDGVDLKPPPFARAVRIYPSTAGLEAKYTLSSVDMLGLTKGQVTLDTLGQAGWPIGASEHLHLLRTDGGASEYVRLIYDIAF